MTRPALLVTLAVLVWTTFAEAQSCPAPQRLVEAPLGFKYCADPAFDAVVDAGVQRIRADVRAQRQAGRLVIYASTPISPRGGGVEKVNIEIATSVKTKLEKAYGAGVWVLDPGAYQLPAVGGKRAGGGEYMVMWTRALAGDDGNSRDVDMVHFTGPRDMRAFFGCAGDDLVGCLERWLVVRAAADAELRRVSDTAAARQDFLRYYAMRASAAYSSGARDEWNIVVRLNRGRRIGEQIAMLFDGQAVSPVEMETEISSGYEVRR